jgi:hypothetical protein
MKTLTENQKEFILEYFFKNEYFNGWRNVAIELLNSGKCVVGGADRIWSGGIGNFIDVKDYEFSYNCKLYEFDLTKFLTSQIFINVNEEYLKNLEVLIKTQEEEVLKSKEKYQQILNLIK